MLVRNYRVFEITVIYVIIRLAFVRPVMNPDVARRPIIIVAGIEVSYHKLPKLVRKYLDQSYQGFNYMTTYHTQKAYV